MDGLDRRAEDAVSRTAAWALWVASAALALATAVAAFLRFYGLGEPSYWLDEILGQVVIRRAGSIPWFEWLTGVHPQHGPLYYALQWLASTLRDDEWGGRFLAALFGLITVPLLWIAGRAAREDRPVLAPLLAAGLLAVSPLHVYYSREARPYALLVLLVTVVLLAILARAPLLAVVALLLMLYTSVASAAAVGSAACAAFAAASLERDPRARRRLLIIALAALLTLALFALLYRSTTGERAFSPFPGLTASLFDSIVRGFAVTALDSPRGGRTAYVLLALSIIGAAALLRRSRAAAGAVIAMACLPVVFSIAGLFAQNHFFGIRYVLAALPAYLLLAGFGIAAAAQVAVLPFRRMPRAIPVVLSFAILVSIALQTWPPARTEARRKLDWRGIAQTIHRYAHRGDLVLMAEPWSGIVLDYYLRRLPPKVEMFQFSSLPLAQRVAAQYPATWLVTGGFNPEVSVRAWMCNYPVVLASSLESFRMHYTSRTGGGFLRERGGAAEWRAVAAALGGTRLELEMTPQEDLLFGEGWAGPEGAGGQTFRWAIGEEATITVPRFGRADRVLRMQASPLDHPSLPRQTMRIDLNGTELEILTLASGPAERSVPAPAALWRDGPNTITFRFGRAVAPADFDPSNRDPRKLSVAFDRIAIDDARAPAADAPGLPALAVRLAAVPPLDEKTTWHSTESRFPPARLKRAAVEVLLGRLGLDPTTTWPRLARGDVRLEDLIETAAYGMDCLDDETFVRQTFTLLMGRPPGDAEVRSLMGVERARVVGRIGKFEEFRERVRGRTDGTNGTHGTHGTHE